MTRLSMKTSIATRPTPLWRRAGLSLLPPMLLVLCVTATVPAHAYLGPGAGLGVIGTLFGIIAAIVLAMFGLLWYPLKRAFGKKAASEGPAASDAPPAAVTDQAPAARTAAPAADELAPQDPTAPKE